MLALLLLLLPYFSITSSTVTVITAAAENLSCVEGHQSLAIKSTRNYCLGFANQSLSRSFSLIVPFRILGFPAVHCRFVNP